jgi:hypothetical protein
VANRVKRRKDEEKKPSETDLELAHVKNQFVDAEDTSTDYRTEAELHRAYFDGTGHWTEDEKKELEKRGQPTSTDNKIHDKIVYMLGVERKGRADPKAYPRNTPSDEEGADAATDALRYVADDNLFHYVRSDAAENLFIEGIAAIQTCVDKKLPKRSRTPKIRVSNIRWDRLYVDPHSMRADYADKKFCGIVTWMDAAEAKAKWSGKKDIIDAAFEQSATQTETFDDKPRWYTNTSGRKRVQIFDHRYIKDGEWHECKFCGGGFLEEPKVSPYLDDEGEPECDIEIQALYREGKDGTPYGLVRRDKDPQDSWNKRQSKSLHLLNTNQVVLEEGLMSPEQIAEIRQEAARPDGVIQHPTGGKVVINKNLDLAQGHVNLMMIAGQQLAASGPNSALMGQTGDMSGRAKQVDQQGGLVAIDKPFDAIKYLTLRVYRQIWNRVTQYWTTETWIRVRDEQHVKFVGLNRKVTRGEVLAKALKGKKDIPDEEKERMLQQIAADPKSQEPAVMNDVTQLDVDIILDEAPDVVTLQQEQFGILVELAKARPEVPFKTLVELSALSSANKRKVLDQDEEPDPMQQQMAAMQMKLGELEMLLAKAKVRREVAATEKDEAAAQETHVDTAVKMATFVRGPEGEPGAPSKTQVSVN